ncbi:MAG: efflux RND transporter permease subunit [Myxococcota bacterium]
MGLPKFAIDNAAFTYFFAVLLACAGVASFFSLGQLEDPVFSIKTAVVVTQYPGASPEEVELEVTDPIEIALQELPQLDFIESTSRAGVSSITVEIKQDYWADRLPQVWDELRRKVNDVQSTMPPGVRSPIILDDFGDVFGMQLALVGEGFTPAEMEEFAKSVRKELSIVDGVSRVDLWGVQERVIYLDISETQLAALGLSDSSIENTLRDQNLVLDAGSVDVQQRRLRIAPTGNFNSPADIGELTVRPSIADSLQRSPGPGQSSELIRIRDLGTVTEAYLDPPFQLMRYNGLPAVGLSITAGAGVNVVDVGKAIDDRVAELARELPVGIEVRRVHWMSDIVGEAVDGFLVSFAQALAIVIVVITLGMGLRMSLIIGTALLMTILGSFVVMSLMGVDLQRMSLGALIIALGMMVDNAVVVADGMMARMKRGMGRVDAAIEAASKPALPLLGATIIGVMAFYPIFASEANAGEYCRTLFSVVAGSLLVSWLVSVTITPLQCVDMLSPPKDASGDLYSGWMFRRFRRLLETTMRFRWVTIVSMVALLGVALGSFGNVKQLFFPDSSMDKFMIDIYAHEGTRIQQLSAELVQAEGMLQQDERVTAVASYIGAGPPRFYLPVEPEPPNPAYAQLVVNVQDFTGINGLIEDIKPRLDNAFPDAIVSIRKFGVGPSNTWKFEARFSGPAVADSAILREIGDRGVAILNRTPLADRALTNWRERVPLLAPDFNQERARWASVSRGDVANATRRAFDGRAVGLYRERDDLLPIVLRHRALERREFNAVDSIQVSPRGSSTPVPLLQAVDGIDVEYQDPIIARYDRRRTITVQANPAPGVTLPELRASVLKQFEAIELPPGYELEWGGEFEDTVDAQKSLVPGTVPMTVIILTIIVGLFGAYRPPLVILLTIPFALIGVVAGLLIFDVPFGFVALLGTMSLIGMMIKNAIVLLDEANEQLAAGKSRYEAIILAAQSRLSPVVLASATTVLGVIPLLTDVFWVGLSVAIMAGLSFGTILTMILVPVNYATLYRLKPDGVGLPMQESTE